MQERSDGVHRHRLRDAGQVPATPPREERGEEEYQLEVAVGGSSVKPEDTHTPKVRKSRLTSFGDSCSPHLLGREFCSPYLKHKNERWYNM